MKLRMIQGIAALLLSMILVVSSPPAGSLQPEDQVAECVVLLHGLGRTSNSMDPLQSTLASSGYRVFNLGYPSTEMSIEKLASRLEQLMQPVQRSNCSNVHFVTHSLGGIVLAVYVQEKKPEGIGRVVMLSPPGHGSELTDELGDNPLYRLLTGPAGQQLGTDPGSLPNRLLPVEFELGVITGDMSFNPFYSWLIPGPDDGKVAVERAAVPGMTDFLVVSHSHTFIMASPQVAVQVRYFLANGEFDRER